MRQPLHLSFKIYHSTLHREAFSATTGSRSVGVHELKALAIQTIREIERGA